MRYCTVSPIVANVGTSEAIKGLKWWKQGETLKVYRGLGTTQLVCSAGATLLLQSSGDNKALVPAAAIGKEGAQFSELCPSNAKLREAHAW